VWGVAHGVPWGARQRGGHRGLQAIGGYQSGYQWPFYWAFLMIPWAHNLTTCHLGRRRCHQTHQQIAH